jgi:mannitol/fructose-specific phosphotransferase system IIA component (Ntr-type)
MKNINNSVVLSELLSPATINLNLRTWIRDSVLQELVNQIPELARQPDAQQTLLRALHDREQLHSTGIGDGIALPMPATLSSVSSTIPSSSSVATLKASPTARSIRCLRASSFC